MKYTIYMMSFKKVKYLKIDNSKNNIIFKKGFLQIRILNYKKKIGSSKTFSI